MKFSSKKTPISIPHPSGALQKEGYVSEDGVWSIHKEEEIGLFRIVILYTLSHLPSGASMPWKFGSLKSGKEFCTEIAPIAEWKTLRTKIVDGKVKVLPESFRKVLGYQCAEIYKRLHSSMDRDIGNV